MDEPFYGTYLQETGLEHPARDLILETLPKTPDDVVARIWAKAENGDVFIKTMASHFLKVDPEYAKSFHNIFLIRDPRQIVKSYSRVIENPTVQDIGIIQQAALYDWYEEHGAKKPIVIDSNDIIKSPRKLLTRLCNYLGIGFERTMLTWPKGPKHFDGIWAPHWYGNVHNSTTFSKQESDEADLPEDQQKLFLDSMQSYRYLYAKSITNPKYAPTV